MRKRLTGAELAEHQRRMRECPPGIDPHGDYVAELAERAAEQARIRELAIREGWTPPERDLRFIRAARALPRLPRRGPRIPRLRRRVDWMTWRPGERHGAA